MKDPRLPSRDWTKLVPNGVFSPAFLDLLATCGVGRLDLDLPPHARPEDFGGSSMRLSIHRPYGFAAKGRICRTSSLHLDRERKFVPGAPCWKECLDYVLAMTRGGAAAAGDLHTFQRGNTVFYRHSGQMERTIEELARSGVVDRLVVAGDWNENAPLSRVDEVEALASAGADELYCGVLSADWEARFGILTANRRVYGNLSSLEELARVVERAHALGKEVSLTLNAQHYSGDQCEYILGFAHALGEWSSTR